MSLSCRARLLLKLEPLFPPVTDAPADGGEQAAYEFAKAAGSYARFVEELGGLGGRTVLDFGCGWGGESAWLAQRAARVVGCDINAQALEDAERFRHRRGIANLSFVRCDDRAMPLEDEQFDAVFSTNVFEHVMRPATMLSEIRRVLKPGGVFFSTFGPLFYSPLGYHLPWATQVPWAHVLFGLKPVIEVRNRRRSPISVTSWEQTGLNRMTFGAFRAAVRQVEMEPARLRRIAVRGQRWLAAMPWAGDYFTFGVDCKLVKPARIEQARWLPRAA